MKKVIVSILIICILSDLYGCSDWNNNSDDGNKVIEQLKEWTGTLAEGFI